MHGHAAKPVPSAKHCVIFGVGSPGHEHAIDVNAVHTGGVVPYCPPTGASSSDELHASSEHASIARTGRSVLVARVSATNRGVLRLAIIIGAPSGAYVPLAERLGFTGAGAHYVGRTSDTRRETRTNLLC
jgi:hypothetical protein